MELSSRQPAVYTTFNEPLIARPPRQPAAADRVRPLVALIVISIFIPEAFGFFLFDLRLTAARALLLVALPALIFAFGELIAAARYRFVVSDLLFPIAMVWMILSQSQIDGLESALKSGGASGLEFGGAYLATRALIRTGGQAQGVARLYCICAAVAGLLGILDIIFNDHILRDGLARLTGYRFYFERSAEPVMSYRLGFLRAQGPLEHPIIYGVVMCYALMLSRVLDRFEQILCRIGCGIGLFISASSAAWEAMAIGIGLAYYCRFARFPARWTALLVAIGLFFSVVFLITVNPLGWIFNHFTLDASTGYFRLMIWDAAGADVMDSPIFGIGTTNDWFRPSWMPSSVDSLWLRSAMLFGIPGSLLIALALIGASIPAVHRTARNAGRVGARDIVLAETLDIVTFLTIFIGFTVFYWGSAWVTLGLLAGLRAYLGQHAADE
jgi:hypothetical protein